MSTLPDRSGYLLAVPMTSKPVAFWRLTVLFCSSLFVLATARADETPQPGMVAAAHPLATEAGVEMLEAGGSAIDAAIAIQAVLTLVEPQSSGIGGGVFLPRW